MEPKAASSTQPPDDGVWFDPGLDAWLDINAMHIPAEAWVERAPLVERAFAAMEALEAGAISNPDEDRRVGHYWLRDPSRAPESSITKTIVATAVAVTDFAERVRSGAVLSPTGDRFTQCVVVGIGGSALGPQFVSRALGTPGVNGALRMYFCDNTDPDGIDRVVAALVREGGLARTLTVVISKSGGTKETRNGMLELAEAYRKAGVDFARSAVAVTGEGSELDRHAGRDGWIARFPMWDWVGGRTSVCSAVGLLPAALEGVDTEAFLDGARAMDVATRRASVRENPAAMLAVAWHHAGGGRGERAMVVLPYKDRLELFSRYLQQLVMESLGKERDLSGAVVRQGIAVYGNKGSTDQHAYVQQLRDGRDDCFITFVEVLRDREGSSMEVEPGVGSGDYLFGFLEGTRRALAEGGRRSLTVTVGEVSARTLGALIALYERAVGLYAAMVNVNAYHQPGVEAGKRAATELLAAQKKIVAALGAEEQGLEVFAAAGGVDGATAFRVLRRLEANGRARSERGGGARWSAWRWRS